MLMHSELCLLVMIHGHMTGHHCYDDWSSFLNDAQSTMTCLSLDNDEHHVTAFRPISEAARSWLSDSHI